MSQFSRSAVKKLCFKRSFNSISGNRGPLLSQINFDQTYFGRFLSGGFWHGGFLARRVVVQGVLFMGLCPEVYVLEPNLSKDIYHLIMNDSHVTQEPLHPFYFVSRPIVKISHQLHFKTTNKKIFLVVSFFLGIIDICVLCVLNRSMYHIAWGVFRHVEMKFQNMLKHFFNTRL